MNEYNRKLSQELIKRYNPIEEQDLKDKFSTVHSLIEVVTELSGKKQK